MHRTALLPVLLTACLAGPTSGGWAPAKATGGPRVIYDPLAEPLPEIPLPNDAATRLDPSTPTGRRVNVSLDAAVTDHERGVRASFNKMDGFSTYLPITVRFDAPIDTADLAQRHANADFRDDAVFLLNVDPDCSRYGEEVALELGRGQAPITTYSHGSRVVDPLAPDGFVMDFDDNTLFDFDPHSLDNQRLFAETNEDRNANGLLDPGEDQDWDGVLDVANLDDPAACDGLELGTTAYDRCVADHLLTFYERETNTLILRPLWPMQEQCTYAVVLTDRLRGEDGLAVESPFPAVNHRDQTADLQNADIFLSRYDLTADNLAFAWTFTTGSMTLQLETVRAGLYGSGPLARLADEFPVTSLRYWTRAEMAAPFGATPLAGHEDDTWLPGACAGSALTTLINLVYGEWGPNMCAVEGDLSAAAMFFGGTFEAPDFMVDKDGQATPRYDQTQEELWELDPVTGEATYGRTTVTFWCSLPYADESADCEPGNPEGAPFCAPFPTVLYSHGYGGSRAEVALHMGRHNAMGYAACSLDAYGHGLNRWIEDPLAKAGIAIYGNQFAEAGASELPGLLTIGRDRDLNNDGLPDPGMDQWTADIFHTRDNVRQSALEITQLVRILRHMDGVTKAADGSLLGDVDQDGVVDWGGDRNTISHWGISLGGILSGVVSGSEPSLDATSPNAGGAGLTDISVRSSQPGVPEAVLLPMMGPVIGGCLPTDGHDNPLPPGAADGSDCLRGRGSLLGPYPGGLLRLMALTQDEAKYNPREIASVEGVMPGDVVVLRNPDNGEEARGFVNARGWFRLGVPADALDAIERRPVLGVPDDDVDGFDLPDPTVVADRLEVTVYVGTTGEVRETVRTFEQEVTFQGSRYPAGATLVALQKGFGYDRQTPDFRRMLGFAQAAIGPADPAIWAARAFMEPLDVSAYDPYRQGGNTHLLVMPTAGDNNVPVNTGIAMGRAAGLLGSWARDPERFGPEVGWRELFAPIPRLGMSADDWMIQHYVIEGDPRLERFPDNPINQQVIYDVDNLSDGTAAFSCGPSDWSATIGENRCPPEVLGQEVFFPIPHAEDPDQALRLDRLRLDGSFDAFRVPVLRPAGQHGIYNAQPFREFDADAFAVNFTVRFLGTGGGDVSHEAGCDCTGTAPTFLRNGEPDFPGIGRQCGPDDMNVCDATCLTGWGLRTPTVAACEVNP